MNPPSPTTRREFVRGLLRYASLGGLIVLARSLVTRRTPSGNCAKGQGALISVAALKVCRECEVLPRCARPSAGVARQLARSAPDGKLLGSTGDSPVPSGDSPLGMERRSQLVAGGHFQEAGLDLPPGRWPGGTGESPVPPSLCARVAKGAPYA